MARKADMRAIREVIDNMDVKLSQVLIETVIIEITLGDELKTGIDWVQRGRQKSTTVVDATDSLGRTLYYPYAKDSSGNYTTTVNYNGTPVLAGTEGASTTVAKMLRTVMNRDGFYNHNSYMLGGGGAGDLNTSTALKGLFTTVASNATDAALGTNPIGSGINYFLKSDRLNLGAVIQATKTDNHARYIASPIVMTVDNKEATIEATSSRQFLTGWSAVSSSYAGSGLPSPNYSAKDIGITLKITPKINPNGTVMLTVEEEYSQVSGKQSMLTPIGSTYTPQDIDVPVTRKMSADVRLENMQTVVLGGLTETATSESESGIPLLKDIPWIGKWLFSSVSQSEDRKELLIFLTPYVLDDEASAQLEALRRKKALSDARPWDDHGWSASPLADPVSRKEQLRRFQDEWKKQDEERKTKLAIEKAKVERARKLEKMSKEEREAWIEIHKDEMEKEEKEAFEKRVEEQKDLRNFVEGLKKKDLEKAEKEIKAADDAAVRSNEYHKFIEDLRKEGKPLPVGETLNRDAEALKNAADGEKKESDSEK